jgi:hypothetical protein
MNDEKLTLYYYDDGLGDAERREIAAALENDASLRARFEALCRELDAWKSPPPVAPPPDMLARFHDTIERAARLEAQRRPAGNPGNRWRYLLLAGSGIVAAALVAGIGIGVYIGGGDTAVPVEVPVAAAPSASYARGLKVHLAKSTDDIALMPMDTSSERAMLAMHIVQQNRIFERAAEQNGSDGLARVLRAFEPLLVELARDDLSPAEATALRDQLMFELNVVLTKLSRDTSEQVDTI